VQVLHLDKTLLTEVPTDALNYLTNLMELNITWNRIQYLENFILDLRQLDTLYLDKVSAGVFVQHPQHPPYKRSRNH
jgi:hypothetical protein